MLFRQLFDRESSTYTYLIADRPGGEALLVDPVLATSLQRPLPEVPKFVDPLVHRHGTCWRPILAPRAKGFRVGKVRTGQWAPSKSVSVPVAVDRDRGPARSRASALPAPAGRRQERRRQERRRAEARCAEVHRAHAT